MLVQYSTASTPADRDRRTPGTLAHERAPRAVAEALRRYSASLHRETCISMVTRGTRIELSASLLSLTLSREERAAEAHRHRAESAKRWEPHKFPVLLMGGRELDTVSVPLFAVSSSSWEARGSGACRAHGRTGRTHTLLFMQFL